MSDPSPTDLRQLLASVPEVGLVPSAAVGEGIEASVRYLDGDPALASIGEDPYWPKWGSPWWHMLLLFELGEARRIPEKVVARMISALEAFPLKIFPITPEEFGSANPSRDVMCHCALGCMVQILEACGSDVDRALPWVRPWFVRYQMADGGLNCDETAYTVTDECASSMVGTIAPFEAMLLGEPSAWSAERRGFLEKAAGFMIERMLMRGSQSKHNADEREAAHAWLQPCQPRFYFYDVLRGLAALVRWAELAGGTLPIRAVAPVCMHLAQRFPDGAVRVERDATAELTTLVRGNWTKRAPASRFPLLDAVAVTGAPSSVVTAQWSRARSGVLRLIDAGRITG